MYFEQSQWALYVLLKKYYSLQLLEMKIRFLFGKLEVN